MDAAYRTSYYEERDGVADIIKARSRGDGADSGWLSLPTQIGRINLPPGLFFQAIGGFHSIVSGLEESTGYINVPNGDALCTAMIYKSGSGLKIANAARRAGSTIKAAFQKAAASTANFVRSIPGRTGQVGDGFGDVMMRELTFSERYDNLAPRISRLYQERLSDAKKSKAKTFTFVQIGGPVDPGYPDNPEDRHMPIRELRLDKLAALLKAHMEDWLE
jgi:hypothetical protein